VATPKLISFDGRAFAVFGTALLRALFTEHGDAEVPNFMVDLTEGCFGKFVRRGKFLFELRRFSARD